MTMRKKGRFLVLLASFVIMFSISSFSAEGDLSPDAKGDMNNNFTQSEKPDDSYLAEFHAQDVVQKLIKRNLEQIYLLKVIVGNFPEADWKTKSENIYKEYRKAIELYYKRDMVFARVYFEQNQKSISDLMKTMSEKYRDDTDKILDKCHEQIIAMHLSPKTRFDPNKYKELLECQMKLQIAYGQMDDAKREYEYRNYEQALYHYRVAKTYAINILENIAGEDGGQTRDDGTVVPKLADIKEEYKFHKADNRNRIWKDRQQQNETKKDQQQ